MDHLHCYHRSLQSKLIRTEAVNVIRITHEQDHSGRFVDDSAFYALCNYIFGTCRGTVAEIAVTRIALHSCVRSHQIDWDGFPVPMFMTNALCKLCTYRTHSTIHPLQLLAPTFLFASISCEDIFIANLCLLCLCDSDKREEA